MSDEHGTAQDGNPPEGAPTRGDRHEGAPTDGVPHEIEVAWGLGERPRRGPKPGLSLDAITRAAVEIADAEGLDSVSMGKVAARLGFTTMSLYRYVGSKDELVQLMSDAAVGAPDVPDGLGTDWRAELRAYTVAVLRRFRLHPWINQVPMKGPPLLPNNIAWMDYALRILAPLPLDAEERISTLLLCSGYARNDALLGAQISAGTGQGTTSEDFDRIYARILPLVADPVRFPALHALVAEGAFAVPGAEASPDPGHEVSDLDDDSFAYGLERILDGIEAHIARRRSGE